MNHVLSKIPRHEQLYKLLSIDEPIYKDIEFTESNYVDYDPDHNLDEECWFKIDEFSKKDFCLPFLKEDFDSKLFDLLDKKHFKDLKYFCSVQEDGQVFCFQKITPSLFFKKKFISFGDVTKLEESENRIIIKEHPNAVYFKETDVLIFKDLSKISSIFEGIDMLYKEATEQEVKDFLDNSFIKLKDFDSSKVSKPNRKRIAMANNTLGRFDDNMKKQLVSYINEYCSEKLIFDEKEGKFEIETDDQLKNLLYGIDQRFYTTGIDHERRLANSVVKI
ncbi:ATP F0F1 synthase synthase [Gallibacterium anatis]|uniref:ATP F0F1 synthase synthase n=1 Tax=Gallibacterium anatis TaxID=750 RepID=UPI003005CF74